MISLEGKPFFYGWYVTGVAFLCNFMATGVGFYIFNAFMKPLCEERGWSRGDINMAPVIGGLTGLIGMYVFGTLVMRVGPRILMSIGPLISGFSFAALGRAQDVWQFYLLFVLLFVGNGAMAGIVANTAVNNWFVLKRGKALGLSTMGISASGAVLPFAAMILLEYTDLEHAFMLIGLSIMVVSPVAWLLVRNRPEDHGLGPDGLSFKPDIQLVPKFSTGIDKASESLYSEYFSARGKSGEASGKWSFSMVVRSATFWKLGLVYAMTMMAVVGVMFQLAPRFEDIGFDKKIAMYMMAITALLGASGKFAWGVLCDHFEPRRVVSLLIFANAAGLGLALVQGSMLTLVLFIIVFGFSMGGVVSTMPVMVAYLFGRDAYASVARFLGLIVQLQLVGYFIMGTSFELTGSYDAAYGIFIVLDFVAAVMILTTEKARIRADA